MNVLSIIKTKKEDITIKDYNPNTSGDVYTITYVGVDKKQYTFQCLGGSERFIIYLKLYEKKLASVEKLLKSDISPFFLKARIKNNLIAVPVSFLILLTSLLPGFIPSTSPILKEIAFYVAITISSITTLGVMSFANSIEYNNQDVQAYVPDKNLVNSFMEFSKKKKYLQSLKEKYQKEITAYDLEDSKTPEEIRLENMKKAAEESNKRADKEFNDFLYQRDYYEYVSLTPSQKRALYEKALKFSKNEFSFRDVPSFMKREQQKELHFLKFALQDEFNLTNTAEPVSDYNSIFTYGVSLNEPKREGTRKRRPEAPQLNTRRNYEERENDDEYTEMRGRRR